MIALDTNVLLRILLDDDPKQSRQAQAILASAARSGQAVLLPDVVLCEVEWVLSSTFGLTRARVAETLRRLLDATEFTFANRSVVNLAVANYERGKAEFSDYLIGATARASGASTTFTFDRDLHKSEDFTLVQRAMA